LVGFASDQGVNRNQGRIGAKHAPDAIKAALAKLPVPLSIQKQGEKLINLVADMGNVACVDDDTIVPEILESAQQTYANQITHILAQHSLAIGLGGGHEIAYGSFMGLWQHLTQTEITLPTIGIINIDAHFDLR
ncbi:arginase family protein, partial [Xanthomonas citri pv. citri]